MNENQHNRYTNEDEIDLRELFMVLWKKKIAIICVTFLAAIIAGLISVFLLTPTYNSKLRIIINMPQVYSTKYGDYSPSNNSNERYINLLTSSTVIQDTIEDMGYDTSTGIEAIRSRITIASGQNTSTITVSSDDPGDAQRLAQTLYDNYTKYLDMMVIEEALDNYIYSYDIALKSDEVLLTTEKETLANNEKLLASIPQFFNQKEAMKEANDSSGSNNLIIIENIINPSYTKLEGDIIVNKQNIYSIESSMRKNQEYLDELNELKSKLDSYNETGDYGNLDSGFIRISQNHAYLSSEPATPGQKTGPNNTRNVIIGALLGGMAIVFIVLIREYWFKPYKKTEDK